MESDRFKKIDQLLEQALEVHPAERAAFLDRVCAGDEALRAEVESLLEAHQKAGSFIEMPAFEVAAKQIAEQTPPLDGEQLAARRVGQFELVSVLGTGGMGDVYLALDTRLPRKVAVKLLPAEFAQDPERVARFEQESRAASALNHPNILTVHDIGQEGRLRYIATEFVDGVTLRQRIDSGRIELKEVLDLALQLTAALHSAHEAGIVHRDIKPENIMVRRDGYVKVLDFGLVKLTEKHFDRRGSETIAGGAMTGSGVPIGTIRYMSPEQALGDVVDHRSDLFSLGVILYEMAAGVAPFSGRTQAAVFNAILNHTPGSLRDIDPELPFALQRIIDKALQKDRELRYQTALDLRADLKLALRKIDSARDEKIGVSTVSGERRRKPRLLRTSLVAASLILAGIVSYRLLRPREPAHDSTERFVKLGASLRLTDQPGEELFVTLSPDGSIIYYSSRARGNWDIYMQRVEGLTQINLTGDSSDEDTQPACSPDGKQIAFRSGRDGGGIYVMGATGENPRRLAGFGYSPVWSPDMKEIAFAVAYPDPLNRSGVPSQLWSVEVATGDKRVVSEGDAVQPRWSPNGHRIAYWGLHRGAQRDLWTVSRTGGDPVQVTDDAAVDWNPIWSPDGSHLYFASDRGGSTNLWRVPIDELSGKLQGPIEPFTIPSSHSQHFSFSVDESRLVYVETWVRENIQRVAFDPVTGIVVGEPVWVTQGSRRTASPDISPDGELLVFTSQGEPQEDLFLARGDGSARRNLTNDAGKDREPRWSPDGKEIAFYSDRSGRYEIWLIKADGTGLRQLTHSSAPLVYNPVWSRDASSLSYGLSGGLNAIIDLANPENERAQPRQSGFPWVSETKLLFTPWSWSADGRTLAGWHSRVDANFLGIALFSPEAAALTRLTDFGSHPVWPGNNRALVFHHGSGIYLVDKERSQVQQLLSVSPNEITGLSVPSNGRWIYFSSRAAEADIWLLALEDQAADPSTR